MEKILLGIALDDSVLDGVIEDLTKRGVEFDKRNPATDNRRTKESVIKALTNPECDYTVCIVAEYLQQSNPFTADDFDLIRTENENTLIIPIIRKEYMGTDFMEKLYAMGITGAVFETDANMSNIATLIKEKGRTRKVCKIYYGIDTSNIKEAASINSVVDPVAMIA